MCFFFFNDTATTEIYTLSLHYALPISRDETAILVRLPASRAVARISTICCWISGTSSLNRALTNSGSARDRMSRRSEEHTSELQSRLHLVCRLLLEKKQNKDRRQCTT